ncbi:hypothetical protein KUV95_11590 [Microbulbifer agarilyticus]|uniref:hypothetical protein n=1 Tax=Microbulbifer agarilyticus TaxID=260552 RepID=UPI001C959DDC|nr:hypothetical protein [Microbulbifer agarilyticus]MBY6189130.1 hypothetical protein [Microbulbifer agarilyticus]MBY6212198.1 hypothetical protein [Microbulbifer agarilyticus]
MSTTRAMHMFTTRVHRITAIRVSGAYFNRMFIAVITVWVMQLTVKQVVRMVAMPHRRVTAACAVGMAWVRMSMRTRHCFASAK